MTNWQSKISDLQALGMTYADIATACDARPSTIGSLGNGDTKSPRGDLAIRLHELHTNRTRRAKQVNSKAA